MVSPTTDRRFGVNGGMAIKVPCRVATTVNITLSGLQTIDGITLVENDRVLVKNQTILSGNGIYNASTSDWIRSIDFNGNRDIVKGTLVRITDGTAYADSYWTVSSSNPITIDSSNITFAQSNNSLTGVSAFIETLLDDTTAANARTTLGAAASDSPTITNNITLSYTDSSASSGPTIILDRNSASPAIADILGNISFTGRNSNNGVITYAELFGRIFDPIAGTEDGELVIRRMVAGAITEGWSFKLGFYNTGAADPGLGNVNVTGGYYINNIQVPGVSATQAEMEAASSITVAATPGNIKGHPGVAKAWGQCGVAGDLSSPSWNVSSISDTGAGLATVNFTIAFSSATYSNYANALSAATTTVITGPRTTNRTASAMPIGANDATSGAASDPGVGYVFGAFGDQ